MRTVLNILNFVLGGFATTLGWLVATFFSIIFIITLPLTRSCWEITKLSLIPYGNEAVHVDELEPQSKNSVLNAGGTVLNIVWLVAVLVAYRSRYCAMHQHHRDSGGHRQL